MSESVSVYLWLLFLLVSVSFVSFLIFYSYICRAKKHCSCYMDVESVIHFKVFSNYWLGAKSKMKLL